MCFYERAIKNKEQIGTVKVTIVFPSHESKDLSVGGIFVPCFSWAIGGRNYVPHPDYPHYRLGDFKYLLQLVKSWFPDESFLQEVAVVIHSNGHGTRRDVEKLLKDIRRNGLEYTVVKLAWDPKDDFDLP